MIDPKTFLNKRIDNNTIHLSKVLGRGSHGIVYLGQYKGKYYAVKCIVDNAMSDNEVSMHSMLSGHENILSLEKVIKEKKHKFIIMQYATHGDLFDILKRKACFDRRDVYLQILDAVHYCHYNFIAHRDLKPENILLMSNYRVKLADFGLSTADPISREYYHGTSTYFSPECQNVLFYSRSSNKNNQYNYYHYMHKNKQTIPGYDTYANDIWSLGIILVLLVFHRHPWLRANLSDPAFASFVSRPSTFFKITFPNITNSFNALLQEIFCLNPENRITLTELRYKILETDMLSPIDLFPFPPVISEKTLFEYTKCYTENSDDALLFESDDEDSLLSTPANASPVLNVKQLV